MTPQSYGLPHKEFREFQENTIEWAYNLPAGTVAVCQQQTGSGKTALPAALGQRHRTIALVELKALQDQYLAYRFEKLMGRSNYDCQHPHMLYAGAKCDDCLYGLRMADCEVAMDCPYLLAKHRAVGSNRVCLNYAYYMLTSRRPYWDKDYLVLDEAHDISQILLRHYSLEINDYHQREYRFAEFPLIIPGMPGELQFGRLLNWIADCRLIVRGRINDLKQSMPASPKKIAPRLRRAERLDMKLGQIVSAIADFPDDWYISSNQEDGLVVRPLTAKHVFKDAFCFDEATIITMSATIGKYPFEVFCEELGIDKYEARDVPSRFTPEERKIVVRKDAPRMSARATPADFEHQADIIAEIIKEAPSDWSGLVLVTRKRESILLRDRLRRRGLGERVWALPGIDQQYIPTDEQLSEWNRVRNRYPNKIAITHSLWTGYNGLDEQLLIIAKIPYPQFGAPGTYQEAWRVYSPTRYRWFGANLLTQGTGRIRRGREMDYGWHNGQVWVVDGSFNGTIRNMMPDEVVAGMEYA